MVDVPGGGTFHQASCVEEVLLVGAGTWGHREDYIVKLSLFFKSVKLQVLKSNIYKIPLKFVKYNNLIFFYTIDDHPKTFIVTSLARFITGRKTYGLILTPRSFSITSLRNILWDLFNFFGRITKCFGAVSIVGGRAYDLPPASALSIVDPAFWPSRWVESESVEGKSKNMRSISAHDSRSKLTLLSIGRIGYRKAHNFLYEIFKGAPILAQHYNLIIAGKPEVSVSPAFIQNLRSVTFLLIAEYLEHEQVAEFFGKADLVWAYSSKDFDQSSGVAALAILNSRVPVVRANSWIHGFLAANSLPHLPLSDSPTEALAQLERIGCCREEFFNDFGPDVFTLARQRLVHLEVSSKIKLIDIFR